MPQSGITLQQNDSDLIERFLAHPNDESFRNLFATLARRVNSYFRARGCDSALSEDLTQDVLMTVYHQCGSLRDRDLFRPWLYRIAKNVLLQHLRRNGREIPTVRMAGLETEPGALGADPLAGARFREWMSLLAADEREIMQLRYLEELEYHEIAELMGLPLGTVQWKIFRSKKKLAAQIAPGKI